MKSKGKLHKYYTKMYVWLENLIDSRYKVEDRQGQSSAVIVNQDDHNFSKLW